MLDMMQLRTEVDMRHTLETTRIDGRRVAGLRVERLLCGFPFAETTKDSASMIETTPRIHVPYPPLMHLISTLPLPSSYAQLTISVSTLQRTSRSPEPNVSRQQLQARLLDRQNSLFVDDPESFMMA